MKQLLFSILIILILFSCKKSNSDLLKPSYVVSNYYQVLTYPKLYTNTGEITDRTIIEHYLNDLGLIRIHYFYLQADTIIKAQPDTINFRSGDTVIFSQPGLFGKRIVKQNGLYKYFYMTDTLIENSRYPGDLDYIDGNIGVFKPYHENFCNSPACYSPYAYVYDAFIASGEWGKLEFPLLTYYMTRNRTVNGIKYSFPVSTAAKQNYNNVLDNSVLSLLQDTDTLAIQTLKRVYTK